MYRHGNVLPRPNGLRENAETVISCRGPGPARDKKEVPGIPVVRKRKKIHICALVAKQSSRTHVVGECEMYKEERDVLDEMSKIDERDMEKFGTLL